MFEIVTSEEFLAKRFAATDPRPLPQVRGHPFFPTNSEVEGPASGTEALLGAFRKLLSARSAGANRSKIDQNGNCEILTYLGAATANKLVGFMTDNEIAVQSRRVDFGNNVVGADPEFSNIREVILSVPRKRLEDLSEKMAKNGSLYMPQKNPFSPPERMEPLRAVVLQAEAVEVERR